nr:hypothetical protein [Microbacterium sp. Se5.02b]
MPDARTMDQTAVAISRPEPTAPIATGAAVAEPATAGMPTGSDEPRAASAAASVDRAMTVRTALRTMSRGPTAEGSHSPKHPQSSSDPSLCARTTAISSPVHRRRAALEKPTKSHPVVSRRPSAITASRTMSDTAAVCGWRTGIRRAVNAVSPRSADRTLPRALAAKTVARNTASGRRNAIMGSLSCIDGATGP